MDRGGADTGQVKRVFVHQRENPIVNRLNKTRVERKPDLREEKEERDKVLRRQQQASQQERVCLHHPLHIPYCFDDKPNANTSPKRKEETRKANEYKEKKWHKDHAYDDVFTEDNLAATNNQDRAEDWEDDFM